MCQQQTQQNGHVLIQFSTINITTYFEGEFDTVEVNGKRLKCRSACSDQEISTFVTTSAYPNKKTFIYREEFCIITRKIVEKCKNHKKRSLEKEYPGICNLVEPLNYIK